MTTRAIKQDSNPALGAFMIVAGAAMVVMGIVAGYMTAEMLGLAPHISYLPSLASDAGADPLLALSAAYVGIFGCGGFGTVGVLACQCGRSLR